MITVDEEMRPETVETLDLRGDIGFLLKDEVEAIDGYDKVLNRAELTDEQKSVLEEIRNDELDHVNKLNEIYKTLATGAIEEDNELAEVSHDADIRDGRYKGYDIEYNFYGKNEYTVQYQGDDVWFKTEKEVKKFIDEITSKRDAATVKDVKSTELVEHIRELFKKVDKGEIQRYKEDIKNKGGYNDLGTRVAWGVLNYATKKAGEKISDFYDTYEVNDTHITTAAKKVLRELGVQLNDSKITDAEVDEFINKIKGRKLKYSGDVLDLVGLYFGKYKWHNNSDGSMTVTVDNGTYNLKFEFGPQDEKERVTVKNVTRVGDEEITGAGYEEADVNEPNNPMCDEEVEDGFLENVLSKGLGVVNKMTEHLDEDTVKENDSADKVEEIMNEALEVQHRLKDTDTANDIGLIEMGNQYRWEEKYGNTLLTVIKTKGDEIKLALDRNGAYVEIPREKFEEMIRKGKLKAVETVRIEKYGNIETLNDYKVKVGDRTFVVSAASPVDAKNKVKSKLEE